jgi:hypothetical protein
MSSKMQFTPRVKGLFPLSAALPPWANLPQFDPLSPAAVSSAYFELLKKKLAPFLSRLSSANSIKRLQRLLSSFLRCLAVVALLLGNLALLSSFSRVLRSLLGEVRETKFRSAGD